MREIDMNMPTQGWRVGEGFTSVIGAQMLKQANIPDTGINRPGIVGVTPRNRSLPRDDQQHTTQPNRVGYEASSFRRFRKHG